jgi:hypothetical protein
VSVDDDHQEKPEHQLVEKRAQEQAHDCGV